MNGPTKARGTRILIAALLILAAYAAHSCARSKGLSQTYSYTVGDDIAARMSAIVGIVAGLEASALVYYDRTTQKIVADVVGPASDPEGAKRELLAYDDVVREYVLAYAKRQHGLDLSDRDVTLVYRNDGGDDAPYEVARRENGAFTATVAPTDSMR